ncbi:MAG TPA: type IV toxin-antitoxin system AbiEi family antitoxin [Candidatus Kapabacteria bacterium]|nr:type IV toxin-antitoxin system AbiEi family antitoxin [Candidatus Kapabacteria bacterium]
MKETGLINKGLLETIFTIVLDIQFVQYYHMFMIHEQHEKMNRSEAAAIIEKGLKSYLINARLEFKKEHSSSTANEIEFNIKYGDEHPSQVTALVRRNLRPSTMSLLESRFNTVNSQFKMLLSDYISPPIADTLRMKKIWFIDEAGNIYIEVPGKIFIFNTNNKKIEIEKRHPLVSQVNGKLFFYLLKNGPQLKSGYRGIAAKSMVSLGKVSQTLAELKRRKIIKIMTDGVCILESLKLLELWVQIYLEKIKPQLFKGKFKWPYGPDFSNIDRVSAQLKTAIGIGGERAAELYTGYLKPAFMDLWVPEIYMAEFVKQVKLLESREGTIRLYTLFSDDILNSDESNEGILLKKLHPLVVYADLLETSDPRCIETAHLIKEKYLGWIR